MATLVFPAPVGAQINKFSRVLYAASKTVLCIGFRLEVPAKARRSSVSLPSASSKSIRERNIDFSRTGAGIVTFSYPSFTSLSVPGGRPRRSLSSYSLVPSGRRPSFMDRICSAFIPSSPRDIPAWKSAASSLRSIICSTALPLPPEANCCPPPPPLGLLLDSWLLRNMSSLSVSAPASLALLTAIRACLMARFWLFSASLSLVLVTE
mmetsp:Transcript_48106/g.102330  ORF Transcript_48106/g.102330 Transcript_48106/m.102330 type:complete len:208 (-) Transcript_48106:750-1373(-)